MTDCQSHHQPTRSNTVDATTPALGLEDRHVAGRHSDSDHTRQTDYAGYRQRFTAQRM